MKVCNTRTFVVDRFIHESCILTPWTITDSFVKAVVDKGGSGSLRILGLGDPSGIGEGYSFLKPVKSSNKQTNDVANCTKKRDLRQIDKMHLDGALLNVGYDRETLSTVPRWYKVELVRHFANIAHDENVATDLHRYARPDKQTGQTMAQDFRKKCMMVWSRQAAALSKSWDCVEVDQSRDSDSDSDSDESDESDISVSDDEIDEKVQAAAAKSKSGPGRRKADPDAADFQKFVNDIGAVNDDAAKAFSFDKQSEIAVRHFSPPERVVKRITTTLKPDGTQIVEVKFITSKNEVIRVVRQQRQSTSRANSGGRFSKISGGAVDTFDEDGGDEQGLRLKFGRIKNKVIVSFFCVLGTMLAMNLLLVPCNVFILCSC